MVIKDSLIFNDLTIPSKHLINKLKAFEINPRIVNNKTKLKTTLKRSQSSIKLRRALSFRVFLALS